MAQAIFAGAGPFGDTLQFRVLARGNQFLFVAQRVGETGGAQVVALADEDRGAEIGVAADRVVAGEDFAAKGQVLAVELLLQRDGVGGDDQLPVLVDGLDDAGEQVGEGFANAGAGLEEQGIIGGLSGGDRPGHGFLLRAVLQLELVCQDAVLGKQDRGQLRRARWRGGLRQSIGG